VLEHRRGRGAGGFAAHGRRGEKAVDWGDIRWRI
jgi:hypothetical protein